jgi:LuxR family transcriptional regulator, glucitol operon activator
VADVDPDVLDAALTMLHNSSMLRRQIVGELNAFSLTDIAEKYLTRIAPPPSDLLQDVAQRLREVRLLTEVNQVSRAAYKYEWTVIECDSRNLDQLIAASMLRRAVSAQRKGEYVQAEQLIDDAKQVIPTFSEIYRIQAGLEVVRQRLYPAEEAFRQAIEYGPRSAKARYARANFLIDHNGDLDMALADIDIALSLDPNEPTIETAKARILTRLGKYAEARDLYQTLLRGIDDRPRRWRIPTRDQAAEAFRRSMEHDREMSDEESFVEHFTAASRILLDAHRRLDWDEKTMARLKRVHSDAARNACQRQSAKIANSVSSELKRFSQPVIDGVLGDPWVKRMTALWPTALAAKLGATVADLAPSQSGSIPDTEPGEVDTLLETYGFIEDRGGRRVFFHSSEVFPAEAWRQMRIGDLVTFRIGANAKGPVAKDVRVVPSH